jgi:hypothetical protein
MGVRVLLAGILLLSPALVVASDDEGDGYDFQEIFGTAMRTAVGRLQSLNGFTSMSYCSADAGRASPAIRKNLAACRRTYLDFYQRDTVDIRFALGYQDSLPQVSDLHSQTVITQRLRDPCPGDSDPPLMICGFESDPNDANVLIRRQHPGPDGRQRTIRLTITPSSATDDDRVNCPTRTAGVCDKTAAQTAQSERARRNFLDGLERADAVFYLGHARAGGGPDFDPPILGSDGHTDYTRYSGASGTQDYRDMLDALDRGKAAGGGARFVGLFACSSSQWFRDGARSSGRDGMGFVGTGNLAMRNDNLVSAMGALDSLLAMRCRDGFEKSLRSPPRSTNHTLSGFFQP